MFIHKFLLKLFILYTIFNTHQIVTEKAITTANCGIGRIGAFNVETDVSYYMRVSNHYPHIIGGVYAKDGQFPWQISLSKLKNGWFLSHNCGGAILNHHWIITAAHCVRKYKNPDNYTIIRVIAGSANRRKGVVYNISKIVVHPYNGYNGDNYDDIALIKIKESILFPRNADYYLVNSICLPNEDDMHTGFATLSGWGLTAFESDYYPEILQKALFLPLIGDEKCRNMFRHSKYGLRKYINGDFICSGTDGRGSWYGDSGGPLIQYVNGKACLIGIASMTEPKDWNNFPSIFTRVSRYIHWIQQSIDLWDDICEREDC